jgi:bifunctional UDP-N-acetylglucosamine pyrophosphorylase / glucosamine-1-phosphate N-acetyltransferase
MIIVVLAAGKSTRFKSSKHKALHEILGKKILHRVSNSLAELGAEQTIYVLGHDLDAMKQELKPHESFVEQKEQLGTAHALTQALKKISEIQSTGILVTCADTPLLTNKTLRELIQSTKQDKANIGILSSILQNPTGYGRIIRKENNFLEKIVEEKDATAEEKQIQEINAGVYFFDMTPAELLGGISLIKNQNAQGEYYLTDIVAWANSQKLKVAVLQCKNASEVLGINNRQDLSQAIKELSQSSILERMKEGVTFTLPETCLIAPEARIGADTIIEGHCQIVGECSIGSNTIIGANCNIKDSNIGDNCHVKSSYIEQVQIGNHCNIGPFANLRPGSIMDDYACVGDFVEIKNSKIGKDSKVPHLSYIGDSILEEDINIGAGTITANYNAITQEKSKCVINSGVKVGSNSVLVAPLEIASGCMIAAGSVLTKSIEEQDSLVLARPETIVKKNWVAEQKKKLNKKKS